MSWADLGRGARELAQLIVDDGWRPDMLLSIARGGLVVGGALAYALDVKNTFTMNVDLDEARVLVVDDVADTGRTLALVKDICAGRVGEVRAAVLYEKPRSEVQCEYVWRRTDRWIDFPWSARGPVAAPLRPGFGGWLLGVL